MNLRAVFALLLSPCLFVGAAWAQLDDGVLDEVARYSAPAPELVKGQIDAWLDGVGAEQGVRDRVEELWSETPEGMTGRDLLRKLTDTLALADPRAKAVVDLCSGTTDSGDVPAFDFLADDETPPLVRNNLRLLLGRWLCQERLYDEALSELEGVEPDEVVDPASLLFYRGVAYHRLLEKKKGLETLATLLDEVADSPRRYISVASLMQEDLRALEEKSLDEISRRMEDVERRLDHARAGKRVQEEERKIVDGLDEMIKKLEEQQQQQQQSSGGSQQSGRPAQDSRILGGSGPGHVDPKKIGSSSGWGDLPPKEREEVLQQIGKDFPPHMRNVIEQYFRRLANEEGRR